MLFGLNTTHIVFIFNGYNSELCTIFIEGKQIRIFLNPIIVILLNVYLYFAM